MAVISRISHQALSGSTYPIAYGSGLGSSVNMGLDTGDKVPNGAQLWDFAHVGDGSGYDGRNYMRWTRKAGVNGDPDNCGFTANPNTVASGILTTAAAGPIFLRARIRVTAPLTLSGLNSSAQCKFFLFGGPGLANGASRMILFLERATDPTYGYGTDDATQLTLRMGAGVSGNHTGVALTVGQWHHLQVAWRYSAAGTPYMRIYRDTNVEGTPTAEHTSFSADGMGGVWTVPESWGTLHWGEISSTNSYTNNDAIVDVMDMELADSFDTSWAPGGGGGGATSAIRRGLPGGL